MPRPSINRLLTVGLLELFLADEMEIWNSGNNPLTYQEGSQRFLDDDLISPLSHTGQQLC